MLQTDVLKSPFSARNRRLIATGRVKQQRHLQQQLFSSQNCPSVTYLPLKILACPFLLG